MIATSKTSNSVIAIVETAAGLRRAAVVIQQFADAARIFAKTTSVGGFSASSLHLQLARRQAQSDLQTSTIPSTLAGRAAPHLKAEQKRSAESSSATTGGGTQPSRNRPETDASSGETSLALATAFSLFHKMLKLIKRGNEADAQRHGKDDSAHELRTPSLGAAHARFFRNLVTFGEALIARVTPVLIRALDGIALRLDWLSRAMRNHRRLIPAATVAIAGPVLALAGLGGAHRFLLKTLRPPFLAGLRDILWLLPAGPPLAIAGYELYRHGDAVRRMLSHGVESAHKAVARLLKWMADQMRSAVEYAGNSIATLTAGTAGALHSSTTAATAARGMNRARVVEGAATVAQPAPMLRAVRWAAAAAAFAAPLMLAQAPAGAFSAPLAFSAGTAHLAAPLSAAGVAQDPIVINYAPNVVIHSEDASDTAALKRRVIEVLERHGRELHQVLAREIVRQQRRDF
jgi:hypothetical protein